MTTQESTENKPEVGKTSPRRTNLYEGIHLSERTLNIIIGMIIGLLETFVSAYFFIYIQGLSFDYRLLASLAR